MLFLQEDIIDSFSYEIKNELITKDLNKKQAAAFIDGIIFSSLKEEGEEIKISFKNALIFNRVLFFLEKCNRNYEVRNKTLVFKRTDLKKLIISDPQLFFAGVFVSSGSISSLQSSSYHLELKIKNKLIADLMLAKLNNYEFKFTEFIKNDYVILYIKKNEQISEFLKAIGSQESFFKFFDAIISRDHKNQITRIGNLDIYNQSKLVDSNALFIENYQFIIEHDLLKKFKKDELIFYKFKSDNPYLPLSQITVELLKKHNIQKTKSGLNHWLIKIRNIVDDYEYRSHVKNTKKS
ncbi:MAG: DNA-binding protein WhiA [Metamycoplasmataceae bacterium]